MRAKLLLVCLLGSAGAQVPEAKPVTTHTGCVTATPDDPKSFVLSEAGSCSLLSGRLAQGRLAGHIAVLRGSVVDATETVPQTILIEGVSSVGAACQETCALEPPGHRGVHKKEKVGTRGGTPGV